MIMASWKYDQIQGFNNNIIQLEQLDDKIGYNSYSVVVKLVDSCCDFGVLVDSKLWFHVVRKATSFHGFIFKNG